MELLIGVAAILSVIVMGALLAWIVARFDAAVQVSRDLVENKSKNYNLAVSLGHAVDLSAAVELQVKEARLLAAKKAAVTRRGTNMRIGSLGNSTLKTAGKGVEDDPWTAAKIAQFHGWEGVRTGFVAAAPAAAATPTAVAVPKPTLIEISDDMPPDEKRKARIANAKANSAYKKALKSAGVDPKAPQPEAAVPAAPSPAATAATANVPPPTLIEISDDMSPEDKRKARIANAKANSAYKKALKAAGVDPKAAAAPAAAAPTPAPAAAPLPAVPANTPPPPDMIEISDDMAPEEIRRARITNAKAKSAYKKALKEAGIDPKTVKI